MQSTAPDPMDQLLLSENLVSHDRSSHPHLQHQQQQLPTEQRQLPQQPPPDQRPLDQQRLYQQQLYAYQQQMAYQYQPHDARPFTCAHVALHRLLAEAKRGNTAVLDWFVKYCAYNRFYDCQGCIECNALKLIPSDPKVKRPRGDQDKIAVDKKFSAGTASYCFSATHTR